MRKTSYFSVRKVKLQATRAHLFFVEGGWPIWHPASKVLLRPGGGGSAQAVKGNPGAQRGEAVRTTASPLSGEQLRDAEAALQRLQGRYSLVLAADWLLRTFRDTLTQKSLVESIPLFLDERRAHLRRTNLPGL